MPDKETPLATDPKPAAAFQLGYFTRDFGLDALNDALPILLDDLHTNAFLGVQQLMLEISRSYEELQSERAKDDWEYKCDLEFGIHDLHIPAMCGMAGREEVPKGEPSKQCSLPGSLLCRFDSSVDVATRASGMRLDASGGATDAS